MIWRRTLLRFSHLYGTSFLSPYSAIDGPFLPCRILIQLTFQLLLLSLQLTPVSVHDGKLIRLHAHRSRGLTFMIIHRKQI